MSNLTDLVKVTVNVSDVRLTLPGFGTPLVIGAHVNFVERFRSYADIAAVGIDFDSGSAFYKAANALFSQEFSPDTVKIGRQQVDITGVAVSTVADSGDTIILTVAAATDGDYIVSLRDNAGSFEVFTHAAVGETAIEIALALDALINASGTLAVSSTDNLDGTLTISADVAETPFQFALSGDAVAPFSVAGGYQTFISDTISGTTSISTSTATTIAGAIVLAVTQSIADQTLLIAVADDADGTYTVTANPLESVYSLSTDSQQTIELNFATGRTGISTLTPSINETLTEAINAIAQTSAEGNDFYGVISASIQAAEVQALAIGIEAQTRIFGTTSSDVNILDTSVTTDIASVLQAQSLNRSWVLFTDNPAEFGDAAWFGRMLPIDPGVDTWNLKALAGVTVSDLTSTQKAAALGKNCNVFIDFAGNNRTTNGTLASGRFIDIQRSQDFMELDIAAAVATRLLASPKVPYSNAGGEILGSIVRSRMQAFNTQTILAPLLDSTTGERYRVTVPDVSDQSAVDRANRLFGGIVAVGQLAGAVHAVEITVNVSV